MAQVTEPVILDSTGQQIVTALNNLGDKVKPTADQIKRTSSNNQTVEAAIVSLNSKLTTINFQHTFSNIAAGAGALETVSIPNPPSGKTLQLATVTQASGLNLVPVWLSGISRGNNTVNVQVYNARTGATDITVEIFALYW